MLKTYAPWFLLGGVGLGIAIVLYNVKRKQDEIAANMVAVKSAPASSLPSSVILRGTVAPLPVRIVTTSVKKDPHA